MHVETIPNRGSRPAILLRETFREDGKVKKRTLANLSDWPAEKIEALKAALRGQTAFEAGEPEVLRTLPHGHVAATLGIMRALGFPELLASKPSRERDLCMGLIASRILRPRSKLATAATFAEESATDTLAAELGISEATPEELYAALDWLAGMQRHIEEKLAKKHLKEDTLVLYDLTSTWFEGQKCPLAKFGYSRDKKRGKFQIVFGVITDADGRPIATEVYSGNQADSTTVASQIAKVRSRFRLKRVILVGDRGTLTEARIREDVEPAELEWITALRASAIKKLQKKGAIQLSLHEQMDLAEVQSPDFPGERLMVCRNPVLAKHRSRKRNELLAATEGDLKAVKEKKLEGAAEIGKAVGAVLQRHKMKKHFDIEIREDGFDYTRREKKIAEEAALDGLYIVRTNVPAERADSQTVVKIYKSLSKVERVFRTMKTVDLEVRPIYHRLDTRVRGHIFMCMLAYYVEWEMRRRLAPLMYTDEHPEEGEKLRSSPVAPIKKSPGATQKAGRKETPSGSPVRTFRGILDDLGTLSRARLRLGSTGPELERLTKPTPLQEQALNLLGVRLQR